MRYHVPINDVTVDEEGNMSESQTVDIVTCTGKPKRRFKTFMRYLSVRADTQDYHTRLGIIRALGFTDLLKGAKS
jgi:hypothetical protein